MQIGKTTLGKTMSCISYHRVQRTSNVIHPSVCQDSPTVKAIRKHPGIFPYKDRKMACNCCAKRDHMQSNALLQGYRRASSASLAHLRLTLPSVLVFPTKYNGHIYYDHHWDSLQEPDKPFTKTGAPVSSSTSAPTLGSGLDPAPRKRNVTPRDKRDKKTTIRNETPKGCITV